LIEYFKLQNPEYAGEQQRKYLERLAELRKLKPKARITFLYSTRCPHCVPPYTIISGSYRPITAMRVGDSCLGVSGHVKVLNTFEHFYHGRLVVIKARGLLPLKLTPEHQVLVVTGAGHNQVMYTKPYWKMAKNVIPKHSKEKGDYLLIPRVKGETDVAELTLEPYTTEWGFKVAKAKGCPTSLPLNYDTAWLLGLYVAEGDTCKTAVRFHLGKHERTLVERLCGKIRKLGYSPRVVENRTTISVEIQSRILPRAFKDWCGQKAENKRVPEFILYHKDNGVIKAFLKGYVEGDGCIIGNLTQITTISLTLALQIQLLNARLGNIAKIWKRHVKDVHYIEGRRIKQKDSYSVGWTTGTNKHRGAILNDFVAYPVESVEFTPYSGTVYNLETGDETYMAFNAVVHNCKLVKPILEEYVRRHPEISLTELNVESKETYTNLLEAILKGELEVPVAVINDRFIVKGDKDFLARLTYAIKLAENTPPTREEEAKWLLKK